MRYKEVDRPPDAEPMGNLLGLSVLRAWREIGTMAGGALAVRHEIVTLPRGEYLDRRIEAIRNEQSRLLGALAPTNINFKTFLPLLLQEKLSPDFPSHYAQGYLHDRSFGRGGLDELEAENRAGVESYLDPRIYCETRMCTNRRRGAASLTFTISRTSTCLMPGPALSPPT